jgi:cytoskeletal protein CcmA (bactofilin family)
MARTFVQQSQISGSLAFNDTMGTGAGELANKQTLVGDLDALRSQINKIIGGERWYDALSGSQDLADIYAALHVTGTGASFQGAMDVAGVADFDSAVFMASDLGVSGSLVVAGLADLNGALEVAGVADFASAAYMASDLGVSGSLTVAGLSDLNGALEVAGVADFASAVYAASDLGVSGSLTVAGPATMNDGLTVSGDRLEVTGSMGITGAVDFDSTLNVDGVADFKADVYMAAALGVSGSASVAGALDAGSLEVAGLSDLNGALEVAGVADFASAVYMASDLGVSGSLTVAQAATLSNGLTVDNAAADFNAGITANEIKIDGDEPMHLYLVGAGGEIQDEADLWFDGSKLYVTGALEISEDLKIGGNDIIDGADATVITFKSINSVASSVEVANNMEVKGDMFYAVSASFSGDVTVQGDLTIQGSMTYIDTENLKVKDALIHLNTGGNSNLSPRGLVLHGDQAYDDLAFGAKPASGDFVLAKEVSDADVDAGNSDVFANAKLAAMWMSEIKLGGIEGSLSGSFVATAAGAELSSTAALSVAAADDMTLGANGEEIGLMSSAEKGDFDTNFDATTIVGALNELFDMIGGGSAAKGDLSVANVSTNTLTFSSIGTLTAAEHKLVDVYLNGVLLSPSRDLSGLTTTTVDLDSAIASGLMADDVITVVIRSAV